MIEIGCSNCKYWKISGPEDPPCAECLLSDNHKNWEQGYEKVKRKK